MILLFDRSGTDWADRTGVRLDSEEGLSATIERLSKGEARIFDLVAPQGSTLQVGLGGSFGFAQFLEPTDDGSKNRATWAARTEKPIATDYIEFMMASTPTPIAPEHCLSFQELFRIIEFFFHTGLRTGAARWSRIC